MQLQSKLIAGVSYISKFCLNMDSAKGSLKCNTIKNITLSSYLQVISWSVYLTTKLQEIQQLLLIISFISNIACNIVWIQSNLEVATFVAASMKFEQNLYGGQINCISSKILY